MGLRNQDFIDVMPASAFKGGDLRRLVACLAEPPVEETNGATGEGASGGASVGSSAGFNVGPWTAELVEAWSIGDSWSDIFMRVAADHFYALSWSPLEVAAQCDDMVFSLVDFIDSPMGRSTL